MFIGAVKPSYLLTFQPYCLEREREGERTEREGGKEQERATDLSELSMPSTGKGIVSAVPPIQCLTLTSEWVCGVRHYLLKISTLQCFLHLPKLPIGVIASSHVL